MFDVPDIHPEAARQSWRAASAVLALATAGLTVFHLAPAARPLAELSYDLALGVAGFAVTRQILAAGPDTSVWRRLAGTWSAAARWSLPALMTVVVAVLAVSVAMLPPADLSSQARTGLWTALGLSGGHLMTQGLYDPVLSGELLLHLWVTGVAAQLVLGWTVVVALMIRAGLQARVGIVAVTGVLLSLGLELWMRSQGQHPQAFLLGPPNLWPFLIGAVVATTPARVKRADAAWRYGPVWLGHLAWPFYLWVWPLTALPRMILARPLSVVEAMAALVAALLLAVATRRWIEQPSRRWAGRSRAALAAVVACGLAIVFASGATLVADGFPARADTSVRTEDTGVRSSPLQALCHVEEGRAPPPMAACVTPLGASADVVVWGNSHVAHLTPAILDWTRRRGLGMRQVTKSGCPTLLVSTAGLASADCLAFNRAAVAEMARGRKPELVVVGAGWTLILARVPGDDRVQARAFERDLAETLRLLRAAMGPDVAIVLMGTTPDFAFAPARCHSRRRFLGLDTARCDLAVPANASMAAIMDRALSRIAAERPGVSVYRPHTVLCPNGPCRTRSSTEPWYIDSNHLTLAGGLAQSTGVAAVLDRAISAPGSDNPDRKVASSLHGRVGDASGPQPSMAIPPGFSGP